MNDAIEQFVTKYGDLRVWQMDNPIFGAFRAQFGTGPSAGGDTACAAIERVTELAEWKAAGSPMIDDRVCKEVL